MDRQSICEIIKNWNESRLDMFAISEPDENLEFHGIIRFFHQFEDGRRTSKCIRCSSQANSAQIIDELVRRFHLPFPSTSTYVLCEMQENGQERKLAPPERPLLVQLGWGKDDREGRFILRAMNGEGEGGNENADDGNLKEEELFKRGGPKRFSKNERKKRAQPQPSKEMMQITNLVKQPIQEEDKDFPYTTFTRTISNPEMVMKRRREQKLGDRLRQLENGGTLKIYGVELFPNRPYISLLVAREDSAKQIVQMALEKYGMEDQNPNAFVLVEIFLTEASLTIRSYSELRGVEKRQERLLGDNECPLQILAEQLNAESANVVFFLRRRPASFPPAAMPKSITLSNFAGSQCSTSSSISMQFQDSRRRHFSASALFQNNEQEILANQNSSNLATSAQLPCLVPINNFASSANFGAAALAIQPGLTEIGSSSSCAIQLRAPSVLPRHCCLLFRDEPNQNGHRVQISLLDKCALVELNGASIHSTVELVNGVQLRIGGIYAYRFFNCVQQQPRRGSCPGQTYQSSNSSSQPSLASTTTISGGGGPIRERPKNPFAFIHHTSNSHQIVDDTGYVDFERPTPTPSTQNTPLSTSTPSKEQNPERMILLNTNNSMVGPMPGQFHHSKAQQQAVQTNPSHFMAIPPQRTLPILLECLDSERENQLFLLELFAEDGANPSQQFAMQFHGVQAQTPFGAFRLIPAFSLYALCRHRLQNCHWELQQQLNQNTFARFIDACNRTIKANLGVREVLVYWLANSSELLNIACSDGELAQSIGVLVKELAQLVQHIFNLFVESCRQRCFIGVQNALNLMSLANPMNLIQTGSLLSALDECLRCARWALLNPALSIQLFSQLFHFISASIFNWLVLSPEARPFLTFRFGIRLKGLLQQIQMWAQKQGLELAAECHMDLLAQTINHLTTPKTLEQIAALGATCYKLNSIQVRYLLENYIGDMRSGESPTVGREVVENVVALARQQADQQAQKDSQGQPQLAESNCLNLPFLIPHDGYVVEKIRGIPPDLASFVNRLQQKGIANVLLQQIGQMPIAEMPWNVFFSSPSTRPQVIASTPILGLSSPKGNSASNRTSTPIIPTTMFPPTVPPHQQQQKGGMGMPIAMPKQKSESPVVYAEVQRRGGANEDYQKQRSVSASILPQTANFHAAGQPNPSSSIPQLKQQQWNERMIDVGGQREVLVQKITIKRAPNEGLGLSIVEMGTPEHGTGIYVKAVISGSPAQKDGRISAGDQLLSVNGQSLLGIQQEMAAQKISGSGPVVHLEVAKKAAQMNGIDHYLQNGYAPQQQQTEIQQQQKANGNGHPPPSLQTMMTTNLGRFNSQPQFQSAGKTAVGPNGAAIRPTSVSELHFHQQQQANEAAAVMMNPTAIGIGGPYAVTTGVANGASLRNPVIYASTGNHHQHQSSSSPYAQLFQHSQQSSSSSLASRLPAHYKTSTNRPQVVLQPGRPASSSPLNTRRSQCTSTPQSDRSTPTMLMLHNEGGGGANQHLTNGGAIGVATASMQIIEPPSRGHFAVDYSQLPAIGQLAESPPINSSTTNSTTSGAAEMGTGENGNGRQKHQLQDFHPIMPNAAASASGRSSAPLFGAEKGGKEMMANQKMEEMERELDELDSSDGQMSDVEQKRYRELLDKLARMRKQKTSANSANLDNLPPSMLAAAHQLERQSKSLAALSLDPGRAFSPISSMASKSATNLGGKMMELEQQRKNEAAARELAHQIAAEVAVQQKRKVPPAVPSKPAIREFMRPPASSSSISPVDATTKKRVQFEEENANSGEERENDEAEEEPRVQIVGAQEIYMNDPRQRRLLELQEANKKLIKPVMDSSALGFREKMRMFAEQIGEKKGPTQSEFRGQQNKSSAERKIEGRKEGDEMAA